MKFVAQKFLFSVSNESCHVMGPGQMPAELQEGTQVLPLTAGWETARTV